MRMRRFWYMPLFLLPILIISLVLVFLTVTQTPAGSGQRSLPAGVSSPSVGETGQTRSTATARAIVPTNTPVSISGERLVIPSIGVNAPVEPVGIASDGSMAVPSQNPWTGVGWYRNGPAPGMRGSAVIDGHLNRPGGCCIPAVFWNLKKMHVGDVVMVEGVRGSKTLKFLVVGVSTYVNNAPTQKIFGNTSGTYLNLITCAGTWIPAQHQTTERLVVYTVLV